MSKWFGDSNFDPIFRDGLNSNWTYMIAKVKEPS